MTHTRIAALLILLTFFTGSLRSQDSLSHFAAAEELFNVMKMGETMQKTVETMMSVLANSNPNLAEFKDILHEYLMKYISWANLKGEFTALYTGEFTEAELREIAAFYRTPTGQKAVAKLPVLMEKGAAVGQRAVKEHIGELQEAIQRRIDERKKDSQQSK